MRSLFLLLALAACNDKVKHTPDAAVHDGQPADGAADAGAQPVTLTITRGGQPQTGIAVYFQNADSSLVTAATTDATGTASTVMMPGGFVTAIDPFQLPLVGLTAHELQTFAGVKPGDHLVLSQHATTGITVNVSAPIDPSSSTAYYFVFTPCDDAPFGHQLTQAGSGANPGGAVTLYGCGAQTDVLVVAEDTDFQAVDFFLATGVAVADQGTVDLAGHTYQAASQRTYSYTNIPDAYASLDIVDALASPRGRVFTAQIGANNNAGTATGTMGIPAFTGAIDVLDTRVFTSFGLQHLVDWAAFATTYSLDVGARLLPALTTLPSVDIANHAVTWGYDTGGTTPDAAWTTLRATRSTLAWTWAIVGPHTGASLAFPVLPAPADAYNLAAGDTTSIDLWRIARVPGGYDAIRAGALSLGDPSTLVLGAAGSLSYEELAPLARTVPHAQRRGL